MKLSRLVAQQTKELEQRNNLLIENSLPRIPKSIEEFAKLITIRSGNRIVPFELYGHQKVMLDLIENNRGFVGIKSRQMGATQTVILRFLYKACLNPAYSALVYSKSQQDTSLIAYRCREMIKSLDGLIELESDNLQTLRISHGGTIYFRNSKIDGARGIDSVSDVLYDEAAFVPEIEEIYAATDPTQAMVGDEARTIVLSTPNGQAGWYFEQANRNNPDDKDLLGICEEIRKQQIEPLQHWIDDDGWVKYIAYWRAHPVYSQEENYLENIAKKRKLPESQVMQEYDLSFEDSSERVFSARLVKDCCVGEFTKEYRLDRQYLIAIDTSLQGQDYYVCLIAEYDPSTQVTSVIDWYRKRGSTSEYNLLKVSEMIDKYEPIKTAIETNSAGIIYLEELEDMHPENYFKPLVTTQNSKNSRITKLLLLMEQGKIIFPNDRIIKEEFLSFEKKGKQLQAISGKHDDIVMAASFLTAIIPSQEATTQKMGTIKTSNKRRRLAT